MNVEENLPEQLCFDPLIPPNLSEKFFFDYITMKGPRKREVSQPATINTKLGPLAIAGGRLRVETIHFHMSPRF